MQMLLVFWGYCSVMFIAYKSLSKLIENVDDILTLTIVFVFCRSG